jgi:hypothetical protein
MYDQRRSYFVAERILNKDGDRTTQTGIPRGVIFTSKMKLDVLSALTGRIDVSEGSHTTALQDGLS